MTNWQRLEQLIKWTGLSTNAFAMAIGLKRSENLYQIKRGSYGISKELASLITKKYPVVSRAWLLTGDGSMLNIPSDPHVKNDVSKVEGAIPFHNIDIIELARSGDITVQKPQGYIVLPSVPSADFAAKCTGEAMSPDIPNGSTVILRAIALEMLIPGESYLIVTQGFAAIRTVRSIESKPECVLLSPKNKAAYDEMTIEKAKIEKLYMIKAVVIYKQ